MGVVIARLVTRQVGVRVFCSASTRTTRRPDRHSDGRHRAPQDQGRVSAISWRTRRPGRLSLTTGYPASLRVGLAPQIGNARAPRSDQRASGGGAGRRAEALTVHSHGSGHLGTVAPGSGEDYRARRDRRKGEQPDRPEHTGGNRFTVRTVPAAIGSAFVEEGRDPATVNAAPSLVANLQQRGAEQIAGDEREHKQEPGAACGRELVQMSPAAKSRPPATP